MPLILSGNVASAVTGYEVANSCRFNDDDSAYMHKTPGSAGNRRTFTFSTWVKRGTIGTAQRIFSQGDHSSGDPMTFLAFKSDDTLQFNRYVSGATEVCRLVFPLAEPSHRALPSDIVHPVPFDQLLSASKVPLTTTLLLNVLFTLAGIVA